MITIQMTTEPNKRVCLPKVVFAPESRCDLVIHFNSVEFHVHSFVLYYHSQYFRALFETPLDDPDKTCSHASCVHIPDDSAIATITTDVFLLFLQHLYYATLLRFPPFIPTDTVLARLEDKPHVYGTRFPTDRVIFTKDYRASETPCVDVIALFHYFDCSKAMERAENVLKTWISMSAVKAWSVLPIADKYGMSKLVSACCTEIACLGMVLDDVYHQAVFQSLTTKNTAVTMLAAFSLQLAATRKQRDHANSRIEELREKYNDKSSDEEEED